MMCVKHLRVLESFCWRAFCAKRRVSSARMVRGTHAVVACTCADGLQEPGEGE